MVVGGDEVDVYAGYAEECLPLQALRIETRPAAASILQRPCKDVQTRSYTRPLGSSLGQSLGREGGQGEDLEELADGGRNGEPAGARRRGAGHVAGGRSPGFDTPEYRGGEG